MRAFKRVSRMAGLLAVSAGLFVCASSGAFAQDTAPPDATATAQPYWLIQHSWAGALAVLLLLAGIATAVALHRAGRRRDLLVQSFDTSSQARQLVGPGGKVIFANAAYRRTFERFQTPLPEILREMVEPGSTSAELLRQLPKTIAEGGRGRAELQLRYREGELDWFDVQAQRLRGGDDYVLWSCDIVTTQRQIEEYIRSDHEKFADLIEHAPIGFYSVDENGEFLFVNSTLAGWLGLQPEPGTSHYRLRLHDILADTIGTGAPPFSPFTDPTLRGGEVTLRGPNGRSFQAFIRFETVAVQAGGNDGDRPRLRTRSAVHDLTRERALEQAVRASEQYFKRFFEEAPTGIALIDASGRIEQANEALMQLLAGADWRKKSMMELVHADDRPAFARHFAEVIRHGKAPPLTVRVAGDRPSYVTIFASRREDSAGSPGCIAHFVDSTEARRLQEQFAQSQKMQAVGLLAGGIAHDFNNLLTAMIGFCDLLLLRHRPGDQSFADIMQIKQNANRAANLVRQLLAFSRQQTLQPRVLDVTDVLGELSHLLRRLIGENIELEMVHGRDLKPIRADAGQLEQVIINLAVNARDAMSGGGKLAIRTGNVRTMEPMQRGADVMPPGSYVMIEIADTGTGIPKEIVDRIFEPFFSTKEVGSGTGLGLSTVYGIVRQTGGFVFVESEVGKGATFRIYLPEHTQPIEAAQSARGADDERRDLTGIGTVLLVEDEDAVRLFSARALRNKGYKVLEARSGEAALEIVNEHLNDIDLVISDVVMPRIDGPTLIKELRVRRPDLRVIFISGYAEDAFRKRVDAGEEAHFLMKPFTLKQLAAKVKEVLP
ncbi:MAG TPA: response regulator [Dongiaceae bacterium]|nr:response regulator [Dongiaceae bacterium]